MVYQQAVYERVAKMIKVLMQKDITIGYNSIMARQETSLFFKELGQKKNIFAVQRIEKRFLE